MKTLTIGSLFVLFAVVAGVHAMPSAFADHATAEVQMGIGSGVQGCEETNECYIPYEVTVDVGGEVTWINEDTAAHTVTAGDPTMGTSEGGFDSGLFLPGTTFSHKFTEAGTYPYFCIVHPWMKGIVNVEDGDPMQPVTKPPEDDDHVDDPPMMPTSIEEVMTTVVTNDAMQGSPMAIDVTFTDIGGMELMHVNYDIMATQGDQVILDDKGAHSHTGMATHTTAQLPANPSESMPVDITVELLGFGVDEITGPSGQVAVKQVVPEFGTIAMMILGIAIISIIALGAKSRVIPRM